eukprot:gene56904-biopygen68901
MSPPPPVASGCLPLLGAYGADHRRTGDAHRRAAAAAARRGRHRSPTHARHPRGWRVGQGQDRVSMLTEWFHRADKDQSGYSPNIAETIVSQSLYLSLDELSSALRGLPYCRSLSQEQLRQMGEYIDIVGNGKVNYLEFLNAFHLEDTS